MESIPRVTSGSPTDDSRAVQQAPRIPRNGAYIRGNQTGKVYKISNGASYHITSWASQGGLKPYTNVDQAAIDHAGRGGVWWHLWAGCSNVYGLTGTEMVAWNIVQSNTSCHGAQVLARYAMFHANGRNFTYTTWRCTAVNVLPLGYPYSINTCASPGATVKFWLNA